MAKPLTDQVYLDLVKDGTIPLLSFWVGEEDFLKTTALACLKAEAIQHHWFVEEYSCNEESPSKIVGRAATTSFLGSKALIIFRDVDRCGPLEQASLKGFSEKPFHDMRLILIASDDMPTDDPFVKNLSTRAVVVEFNPLKGERLHRWVAERASKLNLKLDDRTLKFITLNLGERLIDIAAIIDKLALWCFGNNPISDQMIQDLLIHTPSEVEGMTTSGLKSGNLSDALSAWAHLRLWGIKPEVYISGLFRESARSLHVEEDLEILYATDLALKTGTAPEQALMPLAIARIIHPTHR